jgi:hypothetical protein
MYVRFIAAVAALAAGATGIIVVVLLLRSVPGPTKTATSTPAASAPVSSSPSMGDASSGAISRIATPTSPGYPSPPPGAVVLAREAGVRVLGLAVKSGLVRVSVIAGSGDPESGLKVSVRFGAGYSLPADSCGAGCYQVGLAGRPSSPVIVELAGLQYRFDLPASPVRDGTAIVAKATSTWNALQSLVWHERLASSPTDAIHTLWTAVAPDKLSYTVSGQSSAIIIGGSRWDRPTSTAPWRKSPQDPPLRQPQPFWHGAADVSVLGSSRLDGHNVWHVSFFDPATPSWFEAWIDKQTSRTIALRMTAAAHFMYDSYGPFNGQTKLSPPRG